MCASDQLTSSSLKRAHQGCRISAPHLQCASAHTPPAVWTSLEAACSKALRAWVSSTSRRAASTWATRDARSAGGPGVEGGGQRGEQVEQHKACARFPFRRFEPRTLNAECMEAVQHMHAPSSPSGAVCGAAASSSDDDTLAWPDGSSTSATPVKRRWFQVGWGGRAATMLVYVRTPRRGQWGQPLPTKCPIQHAHAKECVHESPRQSGSHAEACSPTWLLALGGGRVVIALAATQAEGLHARHRGLGGSYQCMAEKAQHQRCTQARPALTGFALLV